VLTAVAGGDKVNFVVGRVRAIGRQTLFIARAQECIAPASGATWATAQEGRQCPVFSDFSNNIPVFFANFLLVWV
jgi:hypothetical protein